MDRTRPALAAAPTSLLQSGSGTLTLQGQLPFADVIVANNGQLVVNGTLTGNVLSTTGTISGTGTIQGSVTTGGMLTTGDGIGMLTIGDDLAPGNDLVVNGGTLVVDIRGASGATTGGVDNDLYDVANDASVAAGTLIVRADGSRRYYEGTTYTFLTAGGALGTDFASIADDLPFLNAAFTSDTNFITLEADASAKFADFASDSNSLSFADYLDLATSPATDDLGSILGELQGTTTANVQSELSQLGGEIYPTLIAAQLQHTSFNLAMLRNQMVMNRSCYTDGNRSMGWVRGYGMNGEADDESQGLSGYDYRLGGTEMAIQRCFGNGISLGAFGNFSWSEVELDAIAQRGQIDSYQFGGTLQHVGEFAYLFAIGGGGFQNYQVDRAIEVGALSGTSQAEYDDTQAFGYLEQGTVWMHHDYAFMPHVGLQYIYLDQDEFAEVSGPVSLSSDSLDTDSLRSILGVSLEKTAPTGLGPATTRLRTGWIHEYFEPQQSVEASYSGGTGTFTTRSLDLGRDWALIGINLQWAMHRNLSLLASYEAQLNDRQSFHTGAGGIEARW